MSHYTDWIMASFADLSDEDRKEAVKLLNEFLNADRSKRRALKEAYESRAVNAFRASDRVDCPLCRR